MRFGSVTAGATFNVAEDLREQLTITVVDATGVGALTFANTLGVVSQGLGINSGGLDLPTQFETQLNESVTFAFNEDLFITEIDLNSTLIGVGTFPEFFEVGGVLIDGNNPGDVFSFVSADSPDGLFVAAGDGVLFQPIGSANGGATTANIDSLTVQIASPPPEPTPTPTPSPSPAVPEPSAAVLLVSLGMIGVARRRRK